MDKQKLEGYKKKLEAERKLLVSEIKQSEKPVDVGNDLEDPSEETDKSEQLGDQLAIAGDLKNRLSEVDLALEKIHNGKYGTCEKCGKPIESEILDIDPESRFCKNDKKGK
jgi:DnaK suppressor protein